VIRVGWKSEENATSSRFQIHFYSRQLKIPRLIAVVVLARHMIPQVLCSFEQRRAFQALMQSHFILVVVLHMILVALLGFEAQTADSAGEGQMLSHV
jgi:hypothetical protein